MLFLIDFSLWTRQNLLVLDVCGTIWNID